MRKEQLVPLRYVLDNLLFPCHCSSREHCYAASVVDSQGIGGVTGPAKRSGGCQMQRKVEFGAS